MTLSEQQQAAHEVMLRNMTLPELLALTDYADDSSAGILAKELANRVRDLLGGE